MDQHQNNWYIHHLANLMRKLVILSKWEGLLSRLKGRGSWTIAIVTPTESYWAVTSERSSLGELTNLDHLELWIHTRQWLLSDLDTENVWLKWVISVNIESGFWNWFFKGSNRSLMDDLTISSSFSRRPVGTRRRQLEWLTNFVLVIVSLLGCSVGAGLIGFYQLHLLSFISLEFFIIPLVLLGKSIFS